MFKVDLNSDLGEGIGLDSEILKHITSANIACGYHAGDETIMSNTVNDAFEKGVSIGAHPGFDDKENFGRVEMNLSKSELKDIVKKQITELANMAKEKGTKLQHVKPHGAMYNMAARDYEIAKTIAEAIYEVDKDLIFLCLANSQMVKAGIDTGLKVANEVFADRAYNNDGTLVSRKLDGSVLHDADVVIQRVIKMVKEKKVTSITNDEISIEVDSICVHGDTLNAVEFVKRIRNTLEQEGITVTSITNVLK